MESELQFIVRNAAADILGSLIDREHLALLLREGNPETLEALRVHIDVAEKAWSQRYRRVAMRDSQMYWGLTAERNDTPNDGTIVTMKWGWELDHTVQMTAEDAWDLAQEILALFPEGRVPMPERPINETFERHSRAFMDAARPLMRHCKGGVSILDVRMWRASGSPNTPLRHMWESFPEDSVEICSVCGSYWRTDPAYDDHPHQVCSGKPTTDEIAQTIYRFDPRRSPNLRQAQRLDRLLAAMRMNGAIEVEMEPIRQHLEMVKSWLNGTDRERWENERVGRSAECEPDIDSAVS